MRGYDHKGILVKGLLKPGPGAAHHWFIGERDTTTDTMLRTFDASELFSERKAFR